MLNFNYLDQDPPGDKDKITSSKFLKTKSSKSGAQYDQPLSIMRGRLAKALKSGNKDEIEALRSQYNIRYEGAKTPYGISYYADIPESEYGPAATDVRFYQEGIPLFTDKPPYKKTPPITPGTPSTPPSTPRPTPNPNPNKSMSSYSDDIMSTQGDVAMTDRGMVFNYQNGQERVIPYSDPAMARAYEYYMKSNALDQDPTQDKRAMRIALNNEYGVSRDPKMTNYYSMLSRIGAPGARVKISDFSTKYANDKLLMDMFKQGLIVDPGRQSTTIETQYNNGIGGDRGFQINPSNVPTNAEERYQRSFAVPTNKKGGKMKSAKSLKKCKAGSDGIVRRGVNPYLLNG